MNEFWQNTGFSLILTLAGSNVAILLYFGRRCLNKMDSLEVSLEKMEKDFGNRLTALEEWRRNRERERGRNKYD